MAVSSKVPHRLDLVIDFVNTLDAEEETDALATPEGLRRWLSEKALLEPAAGSLGDAERLRAFQLREALRDLLLEHKGGPAGTSAVQVLEDGARARELGLRVAGDRAAESEPRRRGFAAAQT